MHASKLSHFSCVWLFETPWTITHQAPLSTGFSRQKYKSGLPFPPPGGLPSPGIEPESPVAPALQADSLLLSIYISQFLICSSFSGHWGCSYILALWINDAVNMRVKTSLWDLISFPFNIYPEVGLLDYKIVLFFIFWGNPCCFP